jgi:hypothetical protein
MAATGHYVELNITADSGLRIPMSKAWACGLLLLGDDHILSVVHDRPQALWAGPETPMPDRDSGSAIRGWCRHEHASHAPVPTRQA